MPALETCHYERRGKETVSAEAVTSHLHMAFVSWLSCDGKKKKFYIVFPNSYFCNSGYPQRPSLDQCLDSEATGVLPEVVPVCVCP